MKIPRLVFLLPVIILFSVTSSVPFTGCTKSNTDTVYINVTHDSAVYVYDTTRVNDTVYDITSGLVAYYNFNGGNLNDSSGYRNNIVFNNAAPTQDRNGKANNAYLFDGATSYMQVTSSASLNPDNITLYAIIKVNGFWPGYQVDHGNFVLVKGWDQAAGMYIMQFSDFPVNPGAPDTQHEWFAGAYGDNQGNNGNAVGAENSTDYVATGTWYKLAFTYDGITAKLYINGALVASSKKTAVFTDNTMDLLIGRNQDPYGLFPSWFNGVIDEIRIYNRALNQQAITQLINVAN
jgi:hypothetical protein